MAAGGLAATPQQRRRAEADTARVAAAVDPFLGRPYLNMSEHATATESAFEADTWARLRAVRATVDPSGLFMANHEIRPCRAADRQGQGRWVEGGGIGPDDGSAAEASASRKAPRVATPSFGNMR